MLVGRSEGGAKREGQSVGITIGEGSSWESDEAKDEERERHEGCRSEQPHVR